MIETKVSVRWWTIDIHVDYSGDDGGGDSDESERFYFHRPVLPSPMIFPSLCLTVSGFDLGLEAARAAFTALAAATYTHTDKIQRYGLQYHSQQS